jgi:hypothetical protein
MGTFNYQLRDDFIKMISVKRQAFTLGKNTKRLVTGNFANILPPEYEPDPGGKFNADPCRSGSEAKGVTSNI